MIFAEFVGTKHLLRFEESGGDPSGMFISERCTDGDVVVGRKAKPKP